MFFVFENFKKKFDKVIWFKTIATCIPVDNVVQYCAKDVISSAMIII